ncbi:Rv1733c family protein [Streptomyces sp. NPDC004561]
MSATRRMWRLRRNVLRRREDVVEAWVLLAVWVLVLVGGAVAGLVTAHAASGVFARQRTDRHAARAVLLAGAPRDTTALQANGRVWAPVRWTAPDGTTRTAQTLVDEDLPTGARVMVWQNGRGDLVPAKPAGRVEGDVESALFGIAAALALAGPVYGAGALARAHIDRRRLAAWDREWELVGPHWSHRTN